MSLCFETIKLEDGKLYNIDEHNFRLNKTITSLYNIKSNINILDHIDSWHDKGLFRCRVIYDKEIKKVEFFPYQKRKTKSFKIITSDIKYNHKYADRVDIDKLFSQRDGCDDILIVDNKGRLKDTSIANIAIKKEGKWVTPKTPLLKGTMRNKLIKENILYEDDIFIKDIENIGSFVIINAMIGFSTILEPKFSF